MSVVPNRRRRWPVVAAWGSAAVALAVGLTLWAWLSSHSGTRGVRPPGTVTVYLSLFAVSVAGLMAGVVSLFGIRSWRTAWIVVPGAILGVGANACVSVLCLLAYAYEGVNPGG